MMPSRFPEIQSYPHIRGLCADALDLYIADLRSMLQLPLRIRREMGPGPDILLVDAEGGGSFASCTLMLDVIAGLSVCLYSRQGRIGLETSRDRGDRYREFLQQYYPWEYESLDSGQVSEILWEFLRNPLVHSLGILPFRGIAVNANRVQINKSALLFQQILELENVARPIWLSSTFELERSTFHVNIPPLYWGLHQLLRNLFSDVNQMGLVETWFENQATGRP